MITLHLDNRLVRIEGADRKTIRALDAITSYYVEGFMFAPAFKAKRWDGKEHLLRYSRIHGYRAPSGLAIDIVRKLKELGKKYKVRFQTQIRHERRTLVWGDVALRRYQHEAIDAVMGPPVRGSGIIKMPVRSGKTKTAAGLTRRLGVPTLFIVPSKLLLTQTARALKECFPTESIGMIGDGVDEQEFITVATIQTLDRMRNKQKGRFKEVAQSFDLVVFDECHHIRGDGQWHKVMYEMDARFKVGLSATAYLESKSENAKGIIWLKATCGPIRIDISTTRLVQEGWLMPQNVKMYKVREPRSLQSWGWSAKLRDKAIYENKVRNRMIVDLAQLHAQAGRKVVIIASRHAHIELLSEQMEDNDLDHRVIIGSHSLSDREDLVDGLVEGRYNVLIGTVLSEGVDIPSVDVVINAEGGKDDKATVQRQRNLTVADGKTKATLVDFMDVMNPYMEKHSKARLKAYQAEEAFNVEVI